MLVYMTIEREKERSVVRQLRYRTHTHEARGFTASESGVLGIVYLRKILFVWCFVRRSHTKHHTTQVRIAAPSGKKMFASCVWAAKLLHHTATTKEW